MSAQNGLVQRLPQPALRAAILERAVRGELRLQDPADDQLLADGDWPPSQGRATMRGR